MRADTEEGQRAEEGGTGRGLLVYVVSLPSIAGKLMSAGCFSAAQKALKMQNRSAEGTRFLMTLLDTLESASHSLSGLLIGADCV